MYDNAIIAIRRLHIRKYEKGFICRLLLFSTHKKSITIPICLIWKGKSAGRKFSKGVPGLQGGVGIWKPPLPPRKRWSGGPPPESLKYLSKNGEF